MTQANFKISVLIPAYNVRAFVAEAVNSVLAQTYSPAEIIVFDDGSSDDTYRVLQGFGDQITLLGPKRLGVVGAKNLLVSQAQYPWIAFHDADDIWTPDKLEKQVAFLQDNPQFDGCLALAKQFIEPGYSMPANFRKELLGEPTAQFFIPNLLTSREVYDSLEAFLMEDDICGSDSDWFVRAKDAGINFGVIDEVLYHRRWHGSNLSHQFQFNNNMLDILRRSVQRKRHESA